jgi:hypothetical protein
MAPNPVELRAIAAECKGLAALAKNEALREHLLDLAEKFERAAREHQLRTAARARDLQAHPRGGGRDSRAPRRPRASG